MRVHPVGIIVASILLGGSLWAGPAAAQIVWPQPILSPVVSSGLTDPVHVTHAGDGSGRLFVVERPGRIRLVKNGVLQSTAFLDIRSRVLTGGERGLLSVAFPPGYASTGRFYVFYTDLGGDLIIARYLVTANPDVADPVSETILLPIEHSSASNHNGGQLAFSPTDGYLYISTGDGGNTPAEARNPASLLGKLLRIDVESGGVPYTIPANNPFLQTSGARGELWARGLRNPWRFAFDRATGDLYLGDVGQNVYEEVDVQRVSSVGGEDYGWNIMEGLHCYPSGTCSQTGLILPVVEYTHSAGRCAVMGGVVSRGTTHPRMQGVYFYADYCSGDIWGLQHDGVTWQSSLLTTFSGVAALTSFGEGEDGAVYFTDSPGGAIYQITDTVTSSAGSDLSVTQIGTPNDASAQPGDSDVPMLQVGIGTGSAGVTLEAFTLEGSGTGNDTVDVQSIHLVLDQNGNGAVDPGETLLGTGAFASDDGTISLAFAPVRIVSGNTKETYLVVYDFALTRAAPLPSVAALGVVALAGVLSRRRVCRAVPLVLGIGLLWMLACSNREGEPPGSALPRATTYQVALTGVTARETSSGSPVTLTGLPVSGPVVTVQ